MITFHKSMCFGHCLFFSQCTLLCKIVIWKSGYQYNRFYWEWMKCFSKCDMEIISLLSIVQSFLGMTESKYLFTHFPPLSGITQIQKWLTFVVWWSSIANPERLTVILFLQISPFSKSCCAVVQFFQVKYFFKCEKINNIYL